MDLEEAKVVKHKPIAAKQPSGGGAMSMFNIGGTSNNANAAPVGAKKLDFNIDNDDFFNSFEPSKPAAEEKKPNPEK
jgi:hypothetical protein